MSFSPSDFTYPGLRTRSPFCLGCPSSGTFLVETILSFHRSLKIQSEKFPVRQPARACRSARVVRKPQESPSEEAGRKPLLRPNCSDTHGFAGQTVWKSDGSREKPLNGRRERSVDRQGDREELFCCGRNPYALPGEGVSIRSTNCTKKKIQSKGRWPRGFRYRPF